MRIPAHSAEIERVYNQTLATGQRALAICSANAGEGVTSLAMALTQRNLMAGRSTLLVDMNLYHPSLQGLFEPEADGFNSISNSTISSSTQLTATLGQPQLVTAKQNAVALTGVTTPKRRDMIMQLRRPGVLEQCIHEWQQHFDSVVFDTSPLNRVNANNIPPEQIAAACDGCILTVLAGLTTEAVINAALEKLNAAGVNLLGCVFNDRDNPSLKDELLREVQRLEPHFNGLARWLKQQLRQNRLLSLEV